jgi:hypothetical protein
MKMANITVGQTWEAYSDRERRWVRVVVAKEEGGTVTLRYEGSLELFEVNSDDLQNSPDRFRLVADC